MATFVLKEDLPKSTQEEIDRIEAITSTSRTTAEAGFLTARTPYRTNRVLRYDTEVEQHLNHLEIGQKIY